MTNESVTPAARVLAAFGAAIALATLDLGEPRRLVWGGASALALVLLGRPPARAFARRLGAVAITALALTFPFWIEGRVEHGGALLARTLSAGAAVLALAGGLDAERLAAGLASLRLPRALVEIVTTSLRQLGELSRLGRRLVLARELRGARGVALGPDVFAALLASAARRGEQVALARELRGYVAGTVPSGAGLRPSDAPFVGAVALLSALPRWM